MRAATPIDPPVALNTVRHTSTPLPLPARKTAFLATQPNLVQDILGTIPEGR